MSYTGEKRRYYTGEIIFQVEYDVLPETEKCNFVSKEIEIVPSEINVFSDWED